MIHTRPVFLAPAVCLLASLAAAEAPTPLLRQYCYQCHGKTSMGDLSLEKLTAQGAPGKYFQQWEKVATAIETKRMPPAAIDRKSTRLNSSHT